MKKTISVILSVFLMAYSLCSLINVVTAFLLMKTFPVGSITILQNVFVGLWEDKHYLWLFSLLVFAVFFCTSFSAIKNRFIILPVITLIYLHYELISLLFLMMLSLDFYGYGKTYVLQLLITIHLVALLSVYIVLQVKEMIQQKNLKNCKAQQENLKTSSFCTGGDI